MATAFLRASGSGGAFTTVNAWRDSLPATLTEDMELVEDEGGQYPAFNITGKVTSAGARVILRSTGAGRPGASGTTGARIFGSANFGCARFETAHIVFDGFTVRNDASTQPDAVLVGAGVTGTFSVNAIVALRSASGTGAAGIRVSAGVGTLRNVLTINVTGSGLALASAATTDIANCTLVNSSSRGVLGAAGKVACRNVVAAGNAIDFQDADGIASGVQSDRNVSSDATAPGATNWRNRTPLSVVFVNPANSGGDWKPLAPSSVLIGNATAISGLLSDLYGIVRGQAWDIGALEAAAEPGLPPIPAGLLQTTFGPMLAMSSFVGAGPPPDPNLRGLSDGDTRVLSDGDRRVISDGG